MTDRQSAYSHGTREGHNVQSAFSPSLPVTPLTSRGGSPSHHRTLGTFTPVTYDMAARSFSTTNITRPGLNLATLPPLSSTMSYPISDAGLPMPNDSLHPRWDTSQPSMSFGLGNAQHQPSSSAVAPSDDLRLQHRSYSVDSGLQSQWAPGQSQPDCNDYYAPRLASYDVNGFGGHRPPLGLSSDFGNALPMASQDHQWQSAQPAPARAPAKRGRKKTDSKEQTFPFRLYELLEKPEAQHIIHWDDTGEYIVVERPEDLCGKSDSRPDELSDTFMNIKSYASFSRQMNIYGWMRKSNLRHVDSSIIDPNASIWGHETLRRGSSKEELLSYKRRVPPRLSQARKRMQAEALSSVSPDSDFQLAPDLHPTLQGFDDGKSAASFAPQVQGPRNLVTSQALDAHHVTRNSWDPITHNLGVTSRRVSYPPATRQEFMDTHRLGIAGRSSTMPSLVHNHTDTMGWNTPSSLPASAVLSPSGAAVPTKPTGYPGQGSLPNLSPPLAFGALWIGDEQKDENLFLRGTQDEPICDLSDVSTWQRSGTGILGNGLRPSEYTPFQSTSLPSNFSSLSQLSLSQSPAFSGEPLSRHMSAAERPAAMPQTVSPGVYQAGFAINKTVDDDISPSSTPSPAPGQGPPSPPMFASRVPKSPTLTKAGRRLSASNAPYGGLSLAHKRTKSTPITGTVRTVDGRRNFSMSISTAHPSSADSESLPSASLSGQPELFGGEFGTRGV